MPFLGPLSVTHIEAEIGTMFFASPLLTALCCFVLLPNPLEQLVEEPSPEQVREGRFAESGEFEAAVGLLVHQKVCSGVMVSPFVLLTAAHCIADVGFGRQVTMHYGEIFDASRRRQASEWGVHPSYCPDCREDQFDIGYVTLTLPYEIDDAEGVPYAIPVATQYEWNEVMREGQSLHLVGYGVSDDPASISGTKRVADVELSELTRSGHEMYAEPLHGVACDGDSGAPYFVVTASREQRLVGIHSRGVECAGTMIGTTPYPVSCWLRDETGVDLLPRGTPDCSSLEIEHGGCRIMAGGAPGRAAVLVGLMFMMIGCPRTRHSRGPRE